MWRLVVFFAEFVALVVLVGCSRGDEAVTTTAVAGWVITDLGTLGRSFISSEAVDVNESGQIVGGSGTGSLGRAFIWQNGTMTPLGTLGGLESSAVAINNRGQVIGGSLTRKPARGHAFLWQDGKMTDLGTLGGRRSGARALNDRGQVVGSSTTASGRGHAVLWTLKRG
jgi:probable HAF family extracellular repeat protein